MAKKVLSEAATVRMAPEGTVGTAPATNWTQIQPNPGGIELDAELETIERDPLSVYATDEKGDVVGLKANVKITQDLNMDWLRLHAAAMFRCVPKHPGGPTTSFVRPSAAVEGTPDSFTVPTMSAALAAGTLIYVLGAANEANNGLHVVDADSTTTSVKVTSPLVAETLPANAILVVVGFQFAEGDLEIDASNNLKTTTKDLTELGLVKGMAVIVGDEATANRPATLPTDRAAVAYLKATPTANAAQLEDHNWAVAGADSAATKTLRLFFGVYFQNYPIGNASYAEQTFHAELEDQNAATGNTVPAFTYGEGLALGMLEINAPLKQKIVATASYVGTDIPDPVLTANRVAGGNGDPGTRPATAYAPLATAMFETSNDLDEVKLYDSSGTLIGEVNSWKLTFNHNVKPREIQGTFGAIDHIFGKFRPAVTFEVYFTDYDQVKAARANRDLKWRAFVANHQGGFAVRMPYTALRQPKKSYAANEAVMFSGSAPGFRDPSSNVVQQMTLFGYVPFGGDQNA